MAQLIKNPPAMWETGFDPWVGKIPWRRERLPIPVFWPGEFGLGSQRVRHDWVTCTLLTCLFVLPVCNRKWGLKALIMCVCLLSCLGHTLLFVTIWTVACQSLLSMGFSRQEYWSGLPWPSPGDIPDPGIEPTSPAALALQANSLLLSHQGRPGSFDWLLKIWVPP